MNKKVLYSAIIFFSVYLYLIYNPIIIQSHENNQQNLSINIYLKELRKGDSVKVFEKFDFDDSKWKICLVLNDRIGISSKVPLGKYFYTNDIMVIKKMKKLSFEYSGGDMATIDNEIIFYKNDQIVFRSFIVLDEKIVGLQNSEFGWINNSEKDMIRIISDFKRNFLPIVFL